MSFSVGQASTVTNLRVRKMKSAFLCRTSEYRYESMGMESKKCLLARTNEYWYESTSMEISEKCLFSVGQASTGTNRRVWIMKNGVFFCRTSEYWYESTSLDNEKLCLFFCRTSEYWYESMGMESKKCLSL